jgi:hypothetical protein
MPVQLSSRLQAKRGSDLLPSLMCSRRKGRSSLGLKTKLQNGCGQNDFKGLLPSRFEAPAACDGAGNRLALSLPHGILSPNVTDHSHDGYYKRQAP